MADTIIAAAERTLPHNLEAERSVLGAILIDNAVWAKAASVIKPTDFYRDAHERIFKAMQFRVGGDERAVAAKAVLRRAAAAL